MLNESNSSAIWSFACGKRAGFYVTSTHSYAELLRMSICSIMRNPKIFRKKKGR